MKAEMPEEKPDEVLFREKVERIADSRIRPLLNLHEGGMTVRDARDGKVWIALTGACKACPSAQATMEDIIGQALKEELKDEFTAVYLVNETDEDLLNFARHLLNKNK